MPANACGVKGVNGGNRECALGSDNYNIAEVADTLRNSVSLFVKGDTIDCIRLLSG